MNANDTHSAVTNPTGNENPPPHKGKGYGCLTFLGVLILILFLMVAGAWWYIYRQFNAKPIEPTVLAKPEQVELQRKIELVENTAPAQPPPGTTGGDAVDIVRQKMDSMQTSREIVLTEREINGLLNHNTDFGKHARIYLEQNRIRGDIHFEAPKDTPFIGGKTIRLNAAMDVQVTGEEVLIRLTTLKVGGIPIPNAWINDMRGKNIAEELFGGPAGVKKFARGIEDFRIEPGIVSIKLRE